MGQLLNRIHERWFIRKRFYKLHSKLHSLSLRGMGLYNYRTDRLSGEEFLLGRLLRHWQAPTILDIGANEGHYARTIKHLSQNALIHAFEPHPKTFSRLAKIAQEHGFHAHQMACGENEGLVDLFDTQGDGSEHASLAAEVLTALHHTPSTQRHPVRVTTVDSFVAEHAVKQIDLMKIDTEGFELAVLKGASLTLQRSTVTAIQFEFNEMNVVTRVYLKDFYQLLPGYTLFRLLPDGLVPVGPYKPGKCELFGFQNLLALSDASPPELRRVLNV